MAGALLAANATPAMNSLRELPGVVYFEQGKARNINVGLPSVFWTKEIVSDTIAGFDDSYFPAASLGKGVFATQQLQLKSDEIGSATMAIKLFGIIPIKKVELRVLPSRYLIPGGLSIGVSLYTKGTLVVGRGEVTDESGAKVSPAQSAGLRPGDVIMKINGVDVVDAAHLAQIVDTANGAALTLEARRNDEHISLRIQPVKERSEGKFKLGIWVRDSTAGVGTLTYYDPINDHFGALGHPITDYDTGDILDVRQGHIYYSKIIDVQQGVKGTPGELHGSFTDQLGDIGVIEKNGIFGIYGQSHVSFENPLYAQPMPIATQQEIHLGKASILTTVESNGINEYQCEIVRLYPQSEAAPKSMVIQITDEELLAKTGGIVQGMSGSPILQEGKIIGAVTHVFYNDPTRGHGVYIEWMLQSDWEK